MLGAALLGVVVVLIAPVGGAALDALLALNLGAALLIAVVCARATSGASLRALPTSLLLATVARLAIEVAATRAILTRGDAGALIPAVGRAALGGEWLVGLAVFAVLVGVQYLVVARGAERVAEVAARFALDALPGRQMSLDAAVRAGLVDAVTAERERAGLAADSAFHASMDGAMKFVRGDALAGVLIAAVNLAAGTALGAVRDGLSVGDAARRYGALAVGQGLLAQVPSLLCALGAGLAVTRAEAGADVAAALRGTFLRERPAVWIAAGCIAVFGVLPGVPLWPFALAAAAVASLNALNTGAAVGARLRLAGPSSTPRLLRAQVASVRAEAARALGCDVPEVEVTVASDWRLSLDDVEVARAADAGAALDALRASIVDVPSAWFGVEESRAWLDAVAARAPILVGAVVPRRVSLSELAAVLRELLDEGVPIVQGREVLERLAAAPTSVASPAALARCVRAGLARSIAARWAPRGAARVIELSPMLEDAVVDAARRTGESVVFTPGPSLRRELSDAVAALGAAHAPLVATSSRARHSVAQALRAVGARFVVVCWEELEGCAIEPAATLGPTAQ